MKLLFILMLIIGFVLVYLIQAQLKKRAIQQHPVVQTRARVISTYVGHRHELSGLSSSVRNQTRYVIFELNTGERKILEVESQYLTDGIEGMLTYQGDRFLSFQY